MERIKPSATKHRSSLQRTLIPLLVIAAFLFVFLVIVENRDNAAKPELSAPQQS